MSERKLPPHKSPLPTLPQCGSCLSHVRFAYQGDMIPSHDPGTRDLRCSECKGKGKGCLKDMRDAYPLHYRELEALPLYLLEAQKTNVELGNGLSHYPMYDKCVNHVNDDWVMVDMDDLKCLCLLCSKRQPSTNRQRSLEDALPMIRERIAIALTSPLVKGTSLCHDSQRESKGGPNGSVQDKPSLLNAAKRMAHASNVLQENVNQVKNTLTSVRNKLLEMRTMMVEEGPRQRLEAVIGGIDKHFRDACLIYETSRHPLIRTRQIISGTILEGVTLLGLNAVEGKTPNTKGEIREGLLKRSVEIECGGKEVMILRTLECLRETLENNDTSLVELTNEDIEGFFNQPGGINEAIEAVYKRIHGINPDTTVPLGTSLVEVKFLIEAVQTVIPHLLVGQHEAWQDVIAEWVRKRKKQSHSQALQTCLDALLYPDILSRPLTHNTLKIIDNAQTKLDHSDALFVEGLRQFSRADAPWLLLSEAEKKGCDHPLLPYFIGLCYRDGGKGVAKCSSKALEYYNKCIKVGSIWGHRGMHIMHKIGFGPVKEDKAKAFSYARELEMEGYVDGGINEQIGIAYSRGVGCNNDISAAVSYLQRAIDDNYTLAAIDLFHLLGLGGPGLPADKRSAMMTLVETENKSEGVYDDRIVGELVNKLIESRYVPSAQCLGRFKDQGEMALHYCNVLIKKRSPLGYQLKGDIYTRGIGGIKKDDSKAVSVWEEADRHGLATFEIYCYHLAPAYIDGIGVPVNGVKALEYCEKALELAIYDANVVETLECMARVYTEGIEPVGHDGQKALDLYRRAITYTYSRNDQADIYDKMAQVYEEGIHPINQDLDMATQLRMIHGPDVTAWMDPNLFPN